MLRREETSGVVSDKAKAVAKTTAGECDRAELSEPATDTSIASKTMPKVKGHVFLHEQGVTYNLISWLHGIRGKAGGNFTQAFMRNKGSHHRLIKPHLRGSQRTRMVRGGGGGLIHSSDETPVMGVERRDQHVRVSE